MTPFNPAAEVTDQQILQMIRQDAETRGGQPPPLPGAPGYVPQTQAGPVPTVTIGTQVIPVTDTAAIQAALNGYQAELTRRAAEVQRAVPQPTAPPTPPPTIPTGPPERWDLEKYGVELQKDPTRATDIALGQAMNLPNGMTASQLIGLLGNRILQTEEALGNMSKEQKATSERIAAAQVQLEAERFTSQHQDYVPDPGNFAILDRHREANGLEPNARGWHLAYLAARDAGEALKLKTIPNGQQPNYQQPQQPGYQSQPTFAGYAPPPPTGLPSLRGSGSESSSSALPQMLQYLDSLPADKWGPAISSFETALGKTGRR